MKKNHERLSHLKGGSAQETLEAALREFQGSVIAVSHDRYFLKQIATRIIAVRVPLARHSDHAPSLSPPACTIAHSLAWPLIFSGDLKGI